MDDGVSLRDCRCPSGSPSATKIRSRSGRPRRPPPCRPLPPFAALCRPLPPFAALAALCRLSRQRFSQVLQQSIEHLVSTPSAIKLAEQPRAPRRGHPDTLHGDFGRAALEVELEEGFRSAAVDDLDPGVGG